MKCKDNTCVICERVEPIKLACRKCNAKKQFFHKRDGVGPYLSSECWLCGNEAGESVYMSVEWQQHIVDNAGGGFIVPENI